MSVEDDNSPSLHLTEDYAEEMFHCFEGIEFSFKADPPTEGVGKLYITTGRIIWIRESEQGSSSSSSSTKGTFKGFDFDIPYIVLHALTHDEGTYNKPCLYCQLDVPDTFDEDDADNEDVAECFFAPHNPDESMLLKLFEAFSEAAQRNPSDDGDEEGELFSVNENELIYDLDEIQANSEKATKLEHLESCFHVPAQFQQKSQLDEQFEDAQ